MKKAARARKPDNGRFLAPLVLAAMAAASTDDDGGIARQGVTSNGFGLVTRVVTIGHSQPQRLHRLCRPSRLRSLSIVATSRAATRFSFPANTENGHRPEQR